jgi:hypothetical protein
MRASIESSPARDAASSARPQRVRRVVVAEPLARLRQVLHERLRVDRAAVRSCGAVVLLERRVQIVGRFAIGVACERIAAGRRQVPHRLRRQPARLGA